MQLKFTKMHGSSNDFIVLDGYSQTLNLTAQDIIFLANRHIGIGADQILIVEPSSNPDYDFKYRIYNADGSEVEHCGNGARCFMKYVLSKNLTAKKSIKVEIMHGIIALHILDNGLVEVDMGMPNFDAQIVGFDTQNLAVKINNTASLYEIKPGTWIAIASMGNPHAVQFVDNLDSYPVNIEGKFIESHLRFKNKANASFIQILDKHTIKIRVYERGVGETLACGTGACASAACAINMGLLHSPIKVIARGGEINVIWDKQSSLRMQGGANIVYEGIIQLTTNIQL